MKEPNVAMAILFWRFRVSWVFDLEPLGFGFEALKTIQCLTLHPNVGTQGL